MTVLYVISHGAAIRKRGERILVENDQGELLQELELRHLESVVILNDVKVTTQALSEMLEQGTELAIMNRHGKLLGQLTPPLGPNIDLRKKQYERERDSLFALNLARKIVEAKVHNQQQILARHALDEPGRQEEAEDSAEKMNFFLEEIGKASSLASLRGFEGMSARAYWSGYATMFKAPGIEFLSRRKHPAPDPVNAVLSFGYVLLCSFIHSVLDAVGFDPYLGFFHTESYGRPALALDLVEPFRAPVVDRMTLRLFNLRMLKPENFESDDKGGVRLERDALQVFFREYEKTLKNLRIRQEIRNQFQQLRRVFFGEEEQFEPYFWKAR